MASSYVSPSCSHGSFSISTSRGDLQCLSPLLPTHHMHTQRLVGLGFSILLCLTVVLMSARFRCGADPCQRSFDSSRAVSLHRLSCPHYEAYVSRPREKLSLHQPFSLPSKRLRVDSDAINPDTTSADPSKPDPVATSPSKRLRVDLEASSAASSSSLGQRTDPALDNQDPETAGSCRPVRTRRMPARFRDVLPEPALPVPADPALLPLIPRVVLHVFDSFRTTFNIFGIAREYRHRPSQDPDAFLTLDELSNQPSTVNEQEVAPAFPIPPVPPWPWKSMSVWRLMGWMLSGSNQKSAAEVSRLANTVITAEDFCPTDLIGFNASTELKHFDDSENDMHPENPFRKDGWLESSVTISVPTRDKNPAGNGQDFTIPNFFHRNLTAVVRAAFSHPSSKLFHFTPFKRIWKRPSSGVEERIYDELYTSDTWIQAHNDIQKQRRTDGCNLERVIAAMMFSSDSTHLAQFGHASAWPVYLSFGNLSKYIRARPITSGACHLVAFIPKVLLSRTVHQHHSHLQTGSFHVI